ncbi:MAG TPA: hypothetical protein VK988_11370 [Acidimicrobiales bacterium]|nr:hypothetical protein [Acidimicrobiales bacterium]
MGVAKLSVSIDERLATAVREHAGERGLSRFTARRCAMNSSASV